MNIAIGGQWAAAFVVLFGVAALAAYAPGNDWMSPLILVIFAFPWIFLRLDKATNGTWRTVLGFLAPVTLNALIVFVLGAAFGSPLIGRNNTGK